MYVRLLNYVVVIMECTYVRLLTMYSHHGVYVCEVVNYVVVIMEFRYVRLPTMW